MPICIDETRPYGFASSKQAIICSLPFEESKIKKIVNIAMMDIAPESSDLDVLLSKLVNSNSYAESATLSTQIKKYDTFSDSQLVQLVAALNNPQVSFPMSQILS